MRLNRLLPAIAMGIAALLTGCSGDKKLLDTVPADAAAVVVLDAEKLVGYMNGPAYGGTLSSDAVLDRFLVKSTERSRSELKALLTSDAVNRHFMVGFAVKGSGSSVFTSMRKGVQVYTFEINNVDRLVEQMGATEAVPTEGFDTYELEGATLFVKGKQGWIAGGDAVEAAKMLAEQLEIASNTPVSAVKGINEYLTDDDGFLRTAISMAQTGEQGWTCVTTSIDDAGKQLEVDADYIGPDGKKADMDKYLGSIDMKLLDYTTPADMIVAAVAVKSSTDWDFLVNYVQAIYPMTFQQRSALAVAMPYLKRIDGTLMVAAGITRDDRVSPGDFTNEINFVAAVQVDKSKAKTMLADLASMASVAGMPMVQKGDDYIFQPSGATPITLKLVNGNCLIITNRQLDQLGNDAARKTLKGNSFGLWANVPNSTGEAVYGGRGFKLTMELDDDFESEFSLNGSTAPILEQLATMMSNDVNETPDESDSEEFMGFTPLDTISAH